jgi:signal transduction histidine kinase
VVGTIYLADKVAIGSDALTSTEFSSEDERLLAMLASLAAAAIDHTRLAEQLHVMAVAAERERIRKDLHDGAIQTIYAVNLELERVGEELETDPEAARTCIDAAIDRLSEVMKDIRGIILGLPPVEQTHSLVEALAALVAHTRAHTMLDAELLIDSPVIPELPNHIESGLLQVARGAVANVVRHAHAGRMWITLQSSGNHVQLSVSDNGNGFEPGGVPSPDRGELSTLRQQAEQLGGALAIQSAPGQGTAIEVKLPITLMGMGEAGCLKSV